MRRTNATLAMLLFAGLALPLRAQHAHHATPPAQAPADATSNTPAPPSPLPPPTPEQLAAAFPDVHGMDMAEHMKEDPWISSVWLDRLEQRVGEDARAWKLQAWSGYSRDRLFVHSHGATDAHGRHASHELGWSHATGPWWNRTLGLRLDDNGDARRHWLSVGVHGHALYKFDADASLNLGEGGRLMATGALAYDTLFTNRLILRSEAGATVHARDDAAMRVGRGLSQLEAGLRLRYEINRHVAPYIGWEWTRAYGRTATMRHAHGDPSNDHGWRLGIRLWY